MTKKAGVMDLFRWEGGGARGGEPAWDGVGARGDEAIKLLRPVDCCLPGTGIKGREWPASAEPRGTLVSLLAQVGEVRCGVRPKGGVRSSLPLAASGEGLSADSIYAGSLLE